MPALSSIVDIVGGGTPSKQNPAYWGGDIPWVSVKDFKSSSIDGSSEYITSAGVKCSATTIIPKGNLIVPTRMALGKVAVNTVDVAINQDLKALLIKDVDVVDRDYLMRVLESKASEIEKKGKGATVKGITLDVLRDLDVPLPPLETQKQIAAILENADQLRKDCRQMEQELNNLAQSVFMDMFGDPVSNPKGWDKASLRSISTKFNDGPFGSNLKTSHYRDAGVQVIRLTNIGSGWFKNEDRKFVSKAHAEKLEKFQCKPGDIVIATLGDPNLRACIIPEDVPLSINKADCVHCVPNSALVRKEYLVEFLNLPSTLKSIENKLHGQTRTRISSGQLAEVEVLIPPLPDQDKFMNAIWSRDKELKRVKAQQIAFDDLFNSLMQKAFSGDLNIKNKAA